MVVQDRSALIEPSCVRRTTEPESLAIEVMTELVGQGTQECAERGDPFVHGGSSPDPND